MSENKRFQDEKLIQISPLDSVMRESGLHPTTFPVIATTICVHNAVFHLQMALSDHSTNGCLLGQDLCFIKSPIPQGFVNIIGAGDHFTSDKLIGTSMGKACSHLGSVLIVVNEGAGRTTE